MKFTLAHNALVPFDDAAREWLGDGTHVVGEIVQAALLDERASAYRAYVFMTITKVAKAAGVTVDQMRTRLQIETGRYQMITLSDQRIALSVKSMNLLSMSDEEIRSFWKDCRAKIEAMLPDFIDIDADEIRQLWRARNMIDERTQKRRELVAQITGAALKLGPEEGLSVLVSALLTAVILHSNSLADSQGLAQAIADRLQAMLIKFDPPMRELLDALDKEEVCDG